MIYSNIAGIKVSKVGLGTVKFGRNTAIKYPEAFQIPSDKEVLKILHTASESGINLLDTAPAYGNCEERLGELLPKSNYPWIISTKVGEVFDPDTGASGYDFTEEVIRASVENSLKKLKRECLDMVLIHSDGDDERIIKDGAIEVLQDLKAKGWIRAVGMSTKTVVGGMLAAEQSDVVMVTHNLSYQGEVEVIEHAQTLGKGVLIKKALGSGHLTLDKPIRSIFDCIYKHAGVSSVVLGSINPSHIQDNVLHALDSIRASEPDIK